MKRKLTRLEAGFSAASPRVLNMIGELGKTYAKSIVPRDSGVLVRNIHFRTLGGGKTVIFANDPFGGGSNSKGPVRYPGRGARSFDLVRWLHMSGARGVVSGDPKFMYSTFDYVRRVAPGIVESEFNKVVVRNK